MKNLTNPTQMLPGFYLPHRGRKPRSTQQVLADKIALFKRKSFKQIGEIFGRFISEDHLKPEPSGVMSRRSIFSKENTFWAFLGQVLDADGGCKEVVRKLQSYSTLKGGKFLHHQQHHTGRLVRNLMPRHSPVFLNIQLCSVISQQRPIY